MTSTLTSKGQMTLPKDVRERLNLKPGDKLNVFVQEGRIVLVPASLHTDDLTSILPRAKKRHSLDEMDRVIRRRAASRST
ncbi:AbrB/MazE/SpoVT family DNA-binding domain-containing protein [bacterium]|nr:MAG: AbrB/MazE/SpoVT family DNA-binding domain-containing protein [bacterium]